MMMSHLMWVCGLKLTECEDSLNENTSHLMWVCGLKPHNPLQFDIGILVTPHVGVWIETHRCRPGDN